jgi:lipoate-protein ligase A
MPVKLARGRPFLYFYHMIRFIIDESEPADFNMAADMYLLERGEGVTVRFYSWARPSITLGYMQSAVDELDLEAVRDGGVDWVKRVTGGRAVLHHGDVTYSCAFPKSVSEMGSGITQTYRLISRCLMAGLELAGIKCAAHDSDNDLRGVGRTVKLPCFLAPNREEIMVGGKKLVGSAQKRTASAVLQHGSIPITEAYRQLPKYLRIDESERETQIKLLTSKSCCVDELISGAAFGSLVQCLMDGFSSVLPFDGELRPWTDREREVIVNSALSLL